MIVKDFTILFVYRPSFKCGTDWGSIAQAGAGLLGSIFNASSAASTNRETLRFTDEQQEKQNAYNTEEAEKARAFLQKMDSSEFSRRVSDMKAAGLNPAFAPVASGDGVGSAPQASASNVTPPHLNAPQVDPLTLSQIELNKSQAKKNEAEAENTEKSTDWMDVLNENVLAYQDSCIELNGSSVRLNDQQKEQLVQLIEESKQKVENLRKEIELMDSEVTMNDIDAFWKSGKYAAEIDSLKADARLSNTQAKELLYLMTSKKQLYEAQAKSFNADVDLKAAQRRYYNTSATEHYWLGRMAYWDAGSSRIGYQIYDKFGYFDKYFGYTERGINTLCNVADKVLMFKKVASQIKQGDRALDQKDRSLDQKDRSLDQYDRRLGQYDADRAQRDVFHSDDVFHRDRSFRQHEKDFGEGMRERQRQFNANWNQRENHHNDFMRRYKRYDD